MGGRLSLSYSRPQTEFEPESKQIRPTRNKILSAKAPRQVQRGPKNENNLELRHSVENLTLMRPNKRQVLSLRTKGFRTSNLRLVCSLSRCLDVSSV